MMTVSKGRGEPPEVMTLYVTYGYGSNLKDCYSVVQGSSWKACYDQISEATSGQYAFTYTAEEFEGQVERYGLREVPLQAQVFPPPTQD